jgi:hypothetical protein
MTATRRLQSNSRFDVLGMVMIKNYGVVGCDIIELGSSSRILEVSKLSNVIR